MQKLQELLSLCTKLTIHVNNKNYNQVSHTYDRLKLCAIRALKEYRSTPDSESKQYMVPVFRIAASQLHVTLGSMKSDEFHNTDFIKFYDNAHELICMLLSV